jgi:diguanylate cyclase (GGDEF)-like protein/PAS domain S-box-containing protein
MHDASCQLTEALAQAIWESAPDAMLLVADDGHIARVNGTAEKLFGYARDEMVGQKVEMLIPRRARDGHVDKRVGYQREPNTRRMGTPLSALAAETKSGEEIAVEVALSPLLHEDKRWTIAVVRDVRIRQALEDELRWASTHDALTGLFNRAYLEEELNRLAKGRRFPVALIVIDIDGLKPVNDEQGHAAGDRLLVDAARMFASVARGDDVVARVGGDEFVIVLPQTTLEVADNALVRLNAAVAQQNASSSGAPVRFSAGVGIAVEPGVIAAALRGADDAMYASKRARRGQVR